VKTIRICLLLAVSGIVLLAQEDPPDRVGRVGFMMGSVSFQPAGVDDWAPASPNRPLTVGDQLWVDNDSRAEVHVGSTAMRLGPQTAFQFLNLNDQVDQIRLSTGSLDVHVRFLDQYQTLEVDTPNLAFSILRPGDYRIDAQPDSQTTLVTVRAGAGEVTGGGQAFELDPGQQASVNGDQSIYYNVYSAPYPDWFDNWCMERQSHEDHLVSLRWVPPEMTGYGDLDDYGDWRNSPYGQVWVPRNVQADWAPYHYGHWAWVDPWGWTWVDDAPWGFAPFHYGRWAYWSNAWVWVPGPVSASPVYAPALVAWVGGARFGLSLSFGEAAVAWVPLGPREVYVPPYQVSPTYVTRVNTTNTMVTNINVTNIYNVTNVTYVNARAPNAVVAVPTRVLASAQPVREAARPVPPTVIASSQIIRTAPVAPVAQSVIGRAGAPVNAPRPPPSVIARPTVAKTAPPPPPVPFVRKQQVLQANGGVPLNPQQMQQIRSSAPPPTHSVVVQAPPARVVQPRVNPNPPPRTTQTGPAGGPPRNNGAPPPPQPNPNTAPAYRPPANNPPPAPATRPAEPANNPPKQKEERSAPVHEPPPPPKRS